MALPADRAHAGTTVIAVMHHLDNVDQADRLLITGHDEVVWFGSRVEAIGHFGVHRLADIRFRNRLTLTPQILLGATILPIRGGMLAVLAKLFSPLSWAQRGCHSEGEGVPAFWQNLGTCDPAGWISIAALVTQLTVATIVTIFVLRWQERAARGRNRAVSGSPATHGT